MSTFLIVRLRTSWLGLICAEGCYRRHCKRSACFRSSVGIRLCLIFAEGCHEASEPFYAGRGPPLWTIVRMVPVSPLCWNGRLRKSEDIGIVLAWLSCRLKSRRLDEDLQNVKTNKGICKGLDRYRTIICMAYRKSRLFGSMRRQHSGEARYDFG
jgi:hypothetical protein